MTGVKSGKTRASKSPLVLAFLLIGRKNGAHFSNQSQSVVKENQSKHEITFDTELKTRVQCIIGIGLFGRRSSLPTCLLNDSSVMSFKLIFTL